MIFSLAAFQDELEKTALLSELWHKVISIFSSTPSQPDKAQQRVDYHFSPRAGRDRWDKLVRNARSSEFVQKLEEHPEADPKLIQHARSMHDLSHGKTIGKIKSTRLPGRSYEIRKTQTGLACTCPDWRFVGSVNPGYECKHIRAFKRGKTEADNGV
jgi:hypothetical protein